MAFLLRLLAYIVCLVLGCLLRICWWGFVLWNKPLHYFLSYFNSWILRKRKEHLEQTASDTALAAAVAFTTKHGYAKPQALKDMGSRLHKYWFQHSSPHQQGTQDLLTVLTVPSKCALVLMEDAGVLNQLLRVIRHSFLHVIHQVEFLPDKMLLVISQPLMQSGSLKDLIYKKEPQSDWSVKYNNRNDRPLSACAIAKYGRQILEALVFLYELGFPPLGHVQTGNIFMDGDECRLGGFLNTLLGYKTRLHLLIGNLDAVDVVMFGHVIFEMACGYELATLVPGKDDWSKVEDPAILEILQVIFDTDKEGHFTSTIAGILAHGFFQDQDTGAPPHPSHVSLGSEIKSLLAKVRMGEPQKQTRSHLMFPPRP